MGLRHCEERKHAGHHRQDGSDGQRLGRNDVGWGATTQLPGAAAFLPHAVDQREFAARGYDLAVTGRDLEAIERCVTEIAAAYPAVRVTGMPLDVTDSESAAAAVAACLSQFGGISGINDEVFITFDLDG